MQRRKTGWWLLCIGLIALSLFGIREWKLEPDGRLHLRFLAVGQGDSALIVLPRGQTILVDGGPDWTTLEALGKYLPFFDRRIDLLVLSHANRDHLTSFPEILRRYRVGGILLPRTDATLSPDSEILTLARASNVPVITGAAGDILRLPDGAAFSVLWPPEHVPVSFGRDANNTALVLKLTYKEHTALFAGDISATVENILVRARADLAATILKVPHHGSRFSSSTGFLLAIRPSLAVISTGPNPYGHPHPSILRRLRSLGIRVERTDENGQVNVVW